MQSLDTVLRDAVASGAAAGIVGVATDAHTTLYEGAAGVHTLGQPDPIRPDSVMAIHSCTKAITSVAAMQLVEQGRLSLDGPIGAVIPELSNPMVYEGLAADGTARLRPAAGPITLRHLLTHSAGYGYDTWSPAMAEMQRVMGLPRIPTDSETLARQPLVFDPGTRWMYGINTDIVGKAVERASGQTLEAYLRDHVTGPLGMTDTAFTLSDAQQARVAGLHRRQADGSLMVSPRQIGQGLGFRGGGGGLCSPPRDYLRFLRMMLAGGTLDGVRILAPETVAQMGRNHLDAGVAVQTMVSSNPAQSLDADFFPEQTQLWGLGFLLNTVPTASGRSPGGMCWAGLANLYFFIDPARGLAGMVSTQTLPFADPRILDVLWRFESALYAGSV